MSKRKENAIKNTTSVAEDKKMKYSPETEKIYKRLLRIMSWIVGVSFALVIILPVLENVALDPITTVIYRVGAVTLIAFTIIEFVSDSVKKFIENRLNG